MRSFVDQNSNRNLLGQGDLGLAEFQKGRF